VTFGTFPTVLDLAHAHTQLKTFIHLTNGVVSDLLFIIEYHGNLQSLNMYVQPFDRPKKGEKRPRTITTEESKHRG